MPSSAVLEEWKTALNSPTDLPKDAQTLADIFAAQADGVLLRLRAHTEAEGFHLDEQIDRNTGMQCSAEDLTWSYAETLNAMNYRAVYTAASEKWHQKGVEGVEGSVKGTYGSCSCKQYGGGTCSGFCSGSTCPCMNCQIMTQTC